MLKEKCRIVDLPKIIDPRGNLTVAEQTIEVPFGIARVYWTYDIPSGEYRGGHAHKTCEEMIVAVSGSFNVTLDDRDGAQDLPPQPSIPRPVCGYRGVAHLG